MSDRKITYIHEYLNDLERNRARKQKLCPWWKSHKWGKWKFIDVEVQYDTPFYKEHYPHVDPNKIYTMPGARRKCLNCEKKEIKGLEGR